MWDYDGAYHALNQINDLLTEVESDSVYERFSIFLLVEILDVPTEDGDWDQWQPMRNPKPLTS